ncbi:hypothetical protein ACFL52_02950 [Candidatus Margulisiibacteriota bacterium]
MAPKWVCGTDWESKVNGPFVGTCLSDNELKSVQRKVDQATERFEDNSENPKDGNFENSLRRLELPVELSINPRKITGCHLGRNVWRMQITIARLRLYLRYLQTRARFYKEAKAYDKEKSYTKAKRIYEELFGGSHRCLEPFQREIDRQIINHAINRNEHRRKIVNFIRDDKKAPLAMLRLGYAQLLLLDIHAEKIIPDHWIKWKNRKKISLKEIAGSLRFNLIRHLKVARDNLKLALKNWRKLPENDKHLKRVKARTLIRIKRAQDSINVEAARYLLESAKRLKVKDHNIALKLVNRSFKFCTGSDDKEAQTSSDLTRAWAYSSRASLKEEKEKGTGKADALKAARIYQRVYGTASPRVLQRLAMSKLEIYLNYADNLKLAEKYDQAIQAYEVVLKGGYPHRQIVKHRARLGIISTTIAKANYDYFKKGDDQQTLAIVEKTSQEAKQLLAEIQRGVNGSFTGKQYKAEGVKLKDTLAWAEATRGRIIREKEGGGKEYFERAEKLYAEISNSLDLNTQIESGITIAQLAMRQGDIYRDLKQYDRSIASYKKIKKEDVIYNRSRLSRVQAYVDKTKQSFARSGNLSGTLINLNKIYNALNSPTLDKRFTETEKLSHKLLKVQVGGTLGWLKIQELKRGEGRIYLNQSIGIIKDIISQLGKIDYKSRTTLLDNVYQTKAQLLLTIAELKKIAAERDENLLLQAEKDFDRAMAAFIEQGDHPKSVAGKIQAKLSKLEAAAMRIKQILWTNQYQKATVELQKINDSSDLLHVTARTKYLVKKKERRLIFRMLSTRALLSGISGGLKEKMKGEGEGRKLFEKARQYNKYAKIIATPELLKESDIPETNLALTRADLLKAEGLKDAGTLIWAIKAYRAIINAPVDSDSSLYYLSQNNQIAARAGRAESYISLGKLLEEEKQTPELLNEVRNLLIENEKNKEKKQATLAQLCYVEAAKNSAEAIGIVNKAIRTEELSRAGLGLRAIKALTGALGSLGRIKEESSQLRDDDAEPFKEYKVALMILHLALKGNNIDKIDTFKEFKDKYKNLISFLDNNRGKDGSIFTHDEVYYSTDTSSWSLPFSYVGFQIAAREYEGAIQSYEETRRSFDTAKSFAMDDRKFLADIHSAMGDLFTYKLKWFWTARKSYRWAREQINQLNAGLKEFPKVKEIERRLLFGEGKILIEKEKRKSKLQQDKRKYKLALLKYKEVLGKLKTIPKKSFKKKDIRDRARAYLSLADVYAYHLDDGIRALEHYRKARNYLSGFEKNMKMRRMLAQSYLGSGDVYRLPKLGRIDFKAAIQEYSSGIKLLENTENNKGLEMLSQLKLALAGALLGIGGSYLCKKAEVLIKEARKLIEPIPQDFNTEVVELSERIEAALVDYWRDSFQNSDWSFGSTLRLIWGSHLGKKEQGQELNLGMRRRLNQNQSLGITYSMSNIKRVIDFANKTRQRLVGGAAHYINLDYRYYNEKSLSWLNWGFSPSVQIGLMGFDTFKYKWGANYPEYENKQKKSHRLLTVAPKLEAVADFKYQASPKLFLMPGARAALSYQTRSGDNAGIVDHIDQEEKSPEKRKPVTPQIDKPWSFKGEAYLRAIVPHLRLGKRLMLSNVMGAVGGMFSYDPAAATANGFWKLDDKITLKRAALTLDFSADLNFTDDYNWMLFVDSHHEIGNVHNYNQARVGARYYPWGLEGYAGGSRFSLGDEQSSNSFFMGLRVNF